MSYQGIIDFRSDTVTRPSKAMIEMMASAKLGDDVLGDDPTVKLLEEKTAQLFGKEAAIFVPTGTQGNVIACKLWTREGERVLLEDRCHIYNFETSQLAMICRLMPRPLASNLGKIPLERLEAEMVIPEDIHLARTTLLVLENTHNFWSGAILSPDYLESAYKLAHQHGLKLHLDGARLWNAAAETDIPLKSFTQWTDSVMACFSKGLGAPIGSILAGPADFILEARRIRKMLGGGMRQVGGLAAAALYALEHNRARLVEDNRRAKKMAEFLAQIPTLEVNLEAVQTNIVFVRVKEEGMVDKWLASLQENGVLTEIVEKDTIRLVTHLDIDDDDVERFIKLAAKFF